MDKKLTHTLHPFTTFPKNFWPPFFSGLRPFLSRSGPRSPAPVPYPEIRKAAPHPSNHDVHVPGQEFIVSLGAIRVLGKSSFGKRTKQGLALSAKEEGRDRREFPSGVLAILVCVNSLTVELPVTGSFFEG